VRLENGQLRGAFVSKSLAKISTLLKSGTQYGTLRQKVARLDGASIWALECAEGRFFSDLSTSTPDGNKQ
jgi:hypothetical protein